MKKQCSKRYIPSLCLLKNVYKFAHYILYCVCEVKAGKTTDFINFINQDLNKVEYEPCSKLQNNI